MLTSFDEFFIHQTTHPLTKTYSDEPNRYDRSFFNGYSGNGRTFFGAAIGRYPNIGIQDCSFTFARDDIQHSFFASKRMSDDPADMSVGPFRIEIIEPMMKFCLHIDENETGISANLEWHPRTANFLEDHQNLGPSEIGVSMETTRFNQFGKWTGIITVAGETIVIDTDPFWGTKDRSWGIRPIGEPVARKSSDPLKGLKFFWAPIHWENHATHMSVFEGDAGQRWHWDGFQLPAYPTPEEIPGIEDVGGIQRALSVDHDFRWRQGTRRVSGGTISMNISDSDPLVMEIKPLLTVQMKGLGYGHPKWGHGRWHGEFVCGAETWSLKDIDPLAKENIHVQEVVSVRCGDQRGIGVLEQLVFGPYPKYDFSNFLDAAT